MVPKGRITGTPHLPASAFQVLGLQCDTQVFKVLRIDHGLVHRAHPYLPQDYSFFSVARSVVCEVTELGSHVCEASAT